VGYAGWTQDQLRMEVELGAWFIFPAEASMVFNADPDSLWLEMIRKTELQLARSESVMTNKAILQPLLWSITPRGAGHDTSFVSFAHSSILRKMLARPGEVVPREEHSGPTGPTKNRFRFVYFGDAVTSWPTAQAPSG
jgi:hypothetical protein